MIIQCDRITQRYLKDIYTIYGECLLSEVHSSNCLDCKINHNYIHCEAIHEKEIEFVITEDSPFITITGSNKEIDYIKNSICISPYEGEDTDQFRNKYVKFITKE